MRLLPAEKVIAAIVLGLAAIDAVCLMLRPIEVDFLGYGSAILIGGVLLAIGQYYRLRRNEEKIALATTGAALFTLFTIVGSISNYMLLPVPAPRIDATLAAIDSALGVHWPSFVNAVLERPWLTQLLAFVYVSSLPQLILVVLVLGFSNHHGLLHKFLLTGLLGALVVMGLWWLFPSSGASLVYGDNQLLQRGASLIVNHKYIVELNRIIQEGVTSISPKSALGLIGFPSFHTVMACMSIFYMLRFRALFILLAGTNMLMVPAIVVHGNHHVTDVLAGIVSFALAACLAHLVVERAQRRAGRAILPSQAPVLPEAPKEPVPVAG
ncbi:MAG: phosphatase PAP2 family protein [Hyphomicrobiales bacterium]|nr:phosphatase PAP2 family protein [Hyphomicrobiales bacterium]